MSYQHLTLAERSMIAPMRILGLSIRHIATQLGRAPSTISRELRRNSDGAGAYAGYWAHRDAQRRRRLAARCSCLTSGALAAYVRAKLQCRWSPEQIAHRLRLDYPHAPQIRISHQTIYTWLAADHAAGGSWSRCLRDRKSVCLKRNQPPRSRRFPKRRLRRLGPCRVSR